jgi:hypothetical protein
MEFQILCESEMPQIYVDQDGNVLFTTANTFDTYYNTNGKRPGAYTLPTMNTKRPALRLAGGMSFLGHCVTKRASIHMMTGMNCLHLSRMTPRMVELRIAGNSPRMVDNAYKYMYYLIRGVIWRRQISISAWMKM